MWWIFLYSSWDLNEYIQCFFIIKVKLIHPMFNKRFVSPTSKAEAFLTCNQLKINNLLKDCLSVFLSFCLSVFLSFCLSVYSQIKMITAYFLKYYSCLNLCLIKFLFSSIVWYNYHLKYLKKISFAFWKLDIWLG